MKVQHQLQLMPPAPIDDTERQAVVEKTIERLFREIESLGSIAGSGHDRSGGGDPRITRRRSCVGAIAAIRSEAFAERLKGLGANVAKDRTKAEISERTDNTWDGKDTEYSWSESANSTPATIGGEFRKRRDGSKKNAELFATGARPAFEVKIGAFVGVVTISDPELRARALGDVLLQLRVPESNARTETQTRISTLGPAALAEERVLLARTPAPSGADLDQLREYALARLAVSSKGNGNAFFIARNTVGKLKKLDSWVDTEKPKGFSHSPYKAIHHNFSIKTPPLIDAAIGEFFFTRGAVERRGPYLVQLVEANQVAKEGDADAARRRVATLALEDAGTFSELSASLEGKDAAEVEQTIFKFLVASKGKTLSNPQESFPLAAELYRSVCDSLPTPRSLSEQMCYAQGAKMSLAAVVARMERGDHIGLIVDLGHAKEALHHAFSSAQSGCDRRDILGVDKEVDRLILARLGLTVERIGDLETDEQLTEALFGLRTALVTALSSGLHAIRDSADEPSQLGAGLPSMLSRIDIMLEYGRPTLDQYRQLMEDAHTELARVNQNLRAFFDARKEALGKAQIKTDGEFLDQLVKESPLHYATAITQKGMQVGLEEVRSDREISNVKGLLPLNTVGEVVFTDLYFADTIEHLLELDPPRDAAAIVSSFDEKGLIRIGGLFVDTKDAPGGNSHAAMDAGNNGVTLLAFPQLLKEYGPFFHRAQKEGGIYVKANGGGVRILTVKKAIEDELIEEKDIPRLKSGFNRLTRYLGDQGEVLAEHLMASHPTRPTLTAELYVPLPQVDGVGRTCASFEALAKLGTRARHLVNEKGTALAIMSNSKALAKHIPGGSAVTTERKAMLLAEAGIKELWDDVWRKDPLVGRVTPENFLQSAFYSDTAYRTATREKLQSETKRALKATLFTRGGGLSVAGNALYGELASHPKLAHAKLWIARSSHGAEDRPNKAAAGQYSSFPNLETPEERIQGIIDVIASTWNRIPIENAVRDQTILELVDMAVVVQRCLENVEFSATIVSYDRATKERGASTYLLVEGFGSGVDGQPGEEGTIRSTGIDVSKHAPGKEGRLIDDAKMQAIHQLGQTVEELFDHEIEPGKGMAVDIEAAYAEGQWWIVQGRTTVS